MSRLLGKSVVAVQKDRLGGAEQLIEQLTEDVMEQNTHEIVVVLKGAGTVVRSSTGDWALNRSGNNGMATGGMGDVLAGLIGGLLVQGYTAWEASAIGVYQHGLAADILAEKTSHGFTASEVADALPKACMLIRDKYKKRKQRKYNVACSRPDDGKCHCCYQKH
ncbi:MAG: NAD(P)H-hydrate dehydratase [Candidatus Electrothrix sp. AS4_5]|nr:NAD(P)H-hydrate dehydratase [Candidatus Electrothrix gigas]